MGRPSKREDILRAGVSVLHKHGYAASSVDSIVAAAGVPKGSFFGHFRSKEEFTKEALDAYFAAWEEYSSKVLAANQMDASKKLITLLEFVSRINSRPKSYDGCLIGNLSLEMAGRSEPIREQMAALLDRWGAPFERVIADGQKSGCFTDRLPAAKLARFVVNLVQGFALRSKVDRSRRARSELKEAAMTLLWTR